MDRSIVRRAAQLLPALLLFWITAGVPALQAQSDEGLTPLQVATLQSVSSVAVAPDGQHIAYTTSVPADPLEENEPAASHLYVLEVTSGETTLVYDETSVGGMAFRPERGTITFLTNREEDDGRALYEVEIGGEVPQRLFAHATSIAGYEWAPDGERIAFMANEELDLPEAELPYEPEVFEENEPQRRGYVADVTSGDVLELGVDGSYYIMSWSPEGERLAASVAPTPHVDDFYMFQSVYVLDASTGNVLAEIENEGKIGQVVWSPDGQQLALRAADHVNDPIDGRILTVSAEGGTPENIRPDFEGKFEHIDWTDDDTIHFIASESVHSSFGTIRPDGSELSRQIARGGPILTGYARAEDGTTVFAAHTPEHPAEVYLLEPGERQPMRMTTTNPGLQDAVLGRQEVVSFIPRDEAFDLEGILIYPVDYEEGTRVPVITVVHGGPESHYSHGWLTGYNLPGQAAAARGYAVFYPNYRGSTGRGLEFAMSSQADLAGAEFDDIVDGIDYLVDAGIADEDRIGVTGGSYGGYATAWMSTYYSDRFAAGVMNVGISNNLSKWGTSDIPEELYLVHARERVYENWEKYLERSPIYWVERANTPLLIAHGAEDTRVHPGQSLELYRHLKVRRPEVPVRLVMYPGEGHGYSRAAARLDYTLRLFQWFDTYLMGDGEEMPPSHVVLEEDAVEVAQ